MKKILENSRETRLSQVTDTDSDICIDVQKCAHKKYAYFINLALIPLARTGAAGILVLNVFLRFEN